jgi:dipeptidase E
MSALGQSRRLRAYPAMSALFPIAAMEAYIVTGRKVPLSDIATNCQGLEMRLYLSSFDLGDRSEELVALAGPASRAAIIVNALDNKPDVRARFLKEQTGKLLGLGFSVAELDLRGYFGKSDKLKVLLRHIDLVWVNGGNAFILRRAMKQSGFDTIIKNAVARDDIVYAGFSAAAVIAFDSLRGLELVDDPYDVPAGYDDEVVWDGLGFVPYALAVHFKSNHPESQAVDREIAFYEGNAVPYRTLKDGQVLIIRDDQERIVGGSDGS